MTSAEQFVKQFHSDAWVTFNVESQGFKVYKDRLTFVALSATVPSEKEAWEDAARSIAAKQRKEWDDFHPTTLCNTMHENVDLSS